MVWSQRELAGAKYRERWVQAIEDAKAHYVVSRTSSEKLEAGTKASWEEISPFLLVAGKPAKENDSEMAGRKLELGTYPSRGAQAPEVTASYHPVTDVNTTLLAWVQSVATMVMLLATMALIHLSSHLIAVLGLNLEEWLKRRDELELRSLTTLNQPYGEEKPQPPEPEKNEIEPPGPRRRCLEI
jgi:hypothetical protein